MLGALIVGGLVGYVAALPVWAKILVALGAATLLSVLALLVRVAWKIRQGMQTSPRPATEGRETKET